MSDNQTTKEPFRWPSAEDLVSAFPGQERTHNAVMAKVREAEAAFAAGADSVSLTHGGQEVGRIYRDGRQWKPA